MQGLYFSTVDELGNETKYEILCAYKLLSTNKNYMIFTENKFDEEGNLITYARIYDPNDETVFDELQTDEEWEEVNKRISEMRMTR